LVGGFAPLILRKQEKRPWVLSFVGLSALAGFTLLYSFIFPVPVGRGYQGDRHLLPIPLLSVMFLPNFGALAARCSARKKVIGLLVLMTVAIPSVRNTSRFLIANLSEAWGFYKEPRPYLYIMQPELCTWVNDNTSKNATVLMFEIEARYLMRRRVIDMEGYMGGLALPYVRVEGGGFRSFFAEISTKLLGSR
jgi:hypothetical protein